jgi:hypothetical protein
MLIGDPIQIKIIEKKIKRRLTEEEKCGQRAIRVYLDEQIRMIRIAQVSLYWLHNTNSCK